MKTFLQYLYCLKCLCAPWNKNIILTITKWEKSQDLRREGDIFMLVCLISWEVYRTFSPLRVDEVIAAAQWVGVIQAFLHKREWGGWRDEGRLKEWKNMPAVIARMDQVQFKMLYSLNLELNSVACFLKMFDQVDTEVLPPLNLLLSYVILLFRFGQHFLYFLIYRNLPIGFQGTPFWSVLQVIDTICVLLPSWYFIFCICFMQLGIRAVRK